jgi:hypothetical protein
MMKKKKDLSKIVLPERERVVRRRERNFLEQCKSDVK